MTSRLDPRHWSSLAWARVLYLAIGLAAVWLIKDPWGGLLTIVAILGIATFDVRWRRNQGSQPD